MSKQQSGLDKYIKLAKRVKWDVAGPLLVASLLVVYLVISLVVGLIGKIPDNKVVEINTNLCGLNAKKTLEIVEKEDRSNPVIVKDYNFYGESLNLYLERYSVDIHNNETFVGKTLSFVDLCTETKIDFAIQANAEGNFTVDQQIELGKLTPGFFAIYLANSDGSSSRLATSSTIVYNQTFTTVVRDGKRMKIELIADKTMFDPVEPTEDQTSVLDLNYLYIKVTEVDASENDGYDVVVSLAPALIETGVSVVGESSYGYTEAELLWPVANEIVTKLQQQGLKVAILKDSYDEEILYYGEGGVLAKAYGMKAKYMLHLDIYDYGGKGIEYSSFSSDALAKSILTEVMTKTTFLQDEDYAISASRQTSELTSLDYDGTYEIREAGGKVLGASEFSTSAAANAKFAANNIYGIQTLVIMPAALTVEHDIKNLAENGNSLADAIVSGFMNYINQN